MKHRFETDLHPSLRELPIAAMEVGAGGKILAANPAFARLVGEQVAERPLGELLEPASSRRLEQLLAVAPSSQEPVICSLTLQGARGKLKRSFFLIRDRARSTEFWLVERPSDPVADHLKHEMERVSGELLETQRELQKKSSRLTRALDEIERMLTDNELLSQQLQEQSLGAREQQNELLRITRDLHQGQDQLLRLNQQVERQSRDLSIALGGRNRFYASMSHELRTPVNAVLGYNDLLLAGVYGELSEQQEIAVERSQRAVRHLRELINDVLDLSHLETGRFQLDVEPVDLAEMLDEVTRSVQPMAEARETVVHCNVTGCADPILTDPGRLRQILLNLISHGIKYGGGKPVWIRCEPSALGGISLEVVNNGPGISADELANVFDEFIPLGGQEQSGTGLGLAIGLRLARLLGGDLVAESTPGVGNTFLLKLPKQPPDRLTGAISFSGLNHGS
jgi:signal transduction histidine kinase